MTALGVMRMITTSNALLLLLFTAVKYFLRAFDLLRVGQRSGVQATYQNTTCLIGTCKTRLPTHLSYPRRRNSDGVNSAAVKQALGRRRALVSWAAVLSCT